MVSPLRESTEEELNAFARVCDQLAGFDERLQPEWVDGYLTAVLAGPRLVAPDEWLERMCGDAFGRAFADPPSVEEARKALFARWTVVVSQLDPERLLDDPDAIFLTPLMWDFSAEERAKLVEEGTLSAEEAAGWPGIGAEWAIGFLDALDDFDDDWAVPTDQGDAEMVFEDLLQAIVVLTLAADGDELARYLAEAYPKALPPPTRDEMIDEACLCVQGLRVFWLDHPHKPAQRIVEAQPGRNDPCPCGSGKKYKKCHGADR